VRSLDISAPSQSQPRWPIALDRHRSINAPMESFFHTLKVELVYQCHWAKRD
jgi:hypothetical protein